MSQVVTSVERNGVRASIVKAGTALNMLHQEIPVYHLVIEVTDSIAARGIECPESALDDILRVLTTLKALREE